MATLVYKSSGGAKEQSSNSSKWVNDKTHYINASKLIDCILKCKSKKVVVERERCIIIPPQYNTKRFTIKLKKR
jgi:hypothetical protein